MNRIVIDFLFACAAIAVFFGISHFIESNNPTNEDPAIVSPLIDGIGKEEIHPEKIEVYKGEAKKKLPIPQEKKDDPASHVAAATETPADGHKHTITTVINADTGEVDTYDHKEPLPWLSAEKTSEIRLDYGIKGHPYPQPVIRISFRADLIQIKSLHFGINTTLDFDGEYFAGGGIGWKF